jgi:hypothetical protein
MTLSKGNSLSLIVILSELPNYFSSEAVEQQQHMHQVNGLLAMGVFEGMGDTI